MAASRQVFHSGVRPTKAGLARSRLLWLRRCGWCGCGQRLASKAHCLDCLVRNREASRRRSRAEEQRNCLSRRLEAANRSGTVNQCVKP